MHHLLGHVSFKKVLELACDPNSGVRVRRSDIATAPACQSCIMAKSRRLRLPDTASRIPATQLGELVHSDTVPVSVTSAAGYTWFVIFLDAWSRWIAVYLYGSKKELLACFMQYTTQCALQHGRDVRVLRGDNEFNTASFRNFCATRGIRQEFSVPHRQGQNGSAERMVRTIGEAIVAIMQHAGLPGSFWAHALLYVVYMFNRTRSTTEAGSMPPILRWSKTMPADTARYHVWGCVCFAHVEKQQRRGKFQARARKALFLGYSTNHDGFVVFLLDTKRVVVRRDVIFDETVVAKDLQLPPSYWAPAVPSGHTSSATLVINIDPGGAPVASRLDANEITTSLNYGPKWASVNGGNYWNKVCEVCNGKTPPLVPCTYCNVALHPMCMNPPQRLPPAGLYACAACTEDAGSPSSVAPAAMHVCVSGGCARHSLRTPLRGEKGGEGSTTTANITAPAVLAAAPRTTAAPEPAVVTRAVATASTAGTTTTPAPTAVPSSMAAPAPTAATATTDAEAKMAPPQLTARELDNITCLEAGLAEQYTLDPVHVLPLPFTTTQDDGGASAHGCYTTTAAAYLTVLAGGEHYEEPLTYRKSLASPQASDWAHAVKTELRALSDMGTFKLVPIPDGRRALTVKWVFKVKTTSDGDLERFKARLVARGFMQLEGVDYGDTYSPVARYASLRFVLAEGAHAQKHIHVTDFTSAFLNSDMDEEEEVFVGIPPGYVESLDTEERARFDELVRLYGKRLGLKLMRGLYGLKQAPRMWSQTLHAFLTGVELKFTQSNFDPCLYYREESDGTFSYLLVYVDDTVLSIRSLQTMEAVKRCLGNKFKMRDLGEICWILRMRVVYNRAQRTLYIDQCRYTLAVLERFKMLEAKAAAVPAPPPRLSKVDGEPLPPSTPYRQAVGALMHLVVGTRPDLAFAVSQVSRFSSAPTTVHWKAVTTILRYLVGTINLGLVFKPSAAAQPASPIRIYAHVDADWGGEPDTRRSTTGFILWVGTMPISWRSKLQGSKTVALSSTESEYVAACGCVQEVMWLRQLVAELGHRQNSATVIFEDNKGVLDLADHPVSGGRTKHIDVKFHYVRQCHLAKSVEMTKIDTKKNTGDLMTKPLGKQVWCVLMPHIMHEVPEDVPAAKE